MNPPPPSRRSSRDLPPAADAELWSVKQRSVMVAALRAVLGSLSVVPQGPARRRFNPPVFEPPARD